MAVYEIDSLTDSQKRELLPFVKRCEDCGCTIIGVAAKRLCQKCRAERLKAGRIEYNRKMYTSIQYEHDPYISKRKGIPRCA